MKVMEFAKENPLTVVLLHGGGLSWWSYKDVAEILAQDYHVVIPLLDGHANSDCDFTTIENAADEICVYIREQFGGSVFAIGGLSLGGQILVEMLSHSPNICQYAIIESALVVSHDAYKSADCSYGSNELWTHQKAVVCQAAI